MREAARAKQQPLKNSRKPQIATDGERRRPSAVDRCPQGGTIPILNRQVRLDRLPPHRTAQPLRQAKVIQMQRSCGNAGVQSMLAQGRGSHRLLPQEQHPAVKSNDEICADPSVNQPGDPYESRMAWVTQASLQRPISQAKESPNRGVSATISRIDRQIQRAVDKGTDGSSWVELTLPDGTYVLEAVNIPGSISWSLKDFGDFADIYATASQYDPKHINGLDAKPHLMRHTLKGVENTEFRIKPGKDLEPKQGQGSAKIQAFRHNRILSDPKRIDAYLRFDTVPLLESPGKTEFVAGNVVDMDPKHHDFVNVAEGTKVGKEETSTITVSDGVTFSTSKTVTNTIGAEITRQLGGEIGIEALGKLTASTGVKLSLKTSVSNMVGTSLSKQIEKSKQVKTTYRFDKPGKYAIVPTCRVWRTPVVANTFDATTGKKTGQKKGFLYTVIYNTTGSTARVVAGRVVGSRRPVLEMSPEQFEKDKDAQKELFAMAKDLRDRQQSFADNLLKEKKIRGGKVKSILKRENFEEFVKGVVAKCKRNGYTRIGQMDDIVRGRFNLRAEADVDTIAAAIKDQTKYPIKEVVAPRRPQKGGGFGYPRWHIIVKDPDTGLTHEWQVGAEAVTEVYETKGIKLPEGLKLGPGMRNDLHDIEYDIFKVGIKEKYPEVHKRHGLPEFHKKVDQVAAEAGRKGAKTPELKKKIKKLHKGAARHLQKLFDEFGADWFKQFYH